MIFTTLPPSPVGRLVYRCLYRTIFYGFSNRIEYSEGMLAHVLLAVHLH